MKTVSQFTRRYSLKEIKAIVAQLGEEIPANNAFWRWTKGERALVPPVELRPARKGGDLWNLSGVILIRWIVRLRREGIPLQRLRRAFDYLRRDLPAALESPHEYSFIITRGRNVALVKPGEPLAVELSELSGQLLALDWLMVRDTVKAAVSFAKKADKRRVA